MERSAHADTFLTGDGYLRNVLVDNVIFGYHEKELKVLLQQPSNFEKWTVTGGYIRKEESIETAAERTAFDRTGLKDLFFQQFRAFGAPDRGKDSAKDPEKIAASLGVKLPPDLWIFDRFVSVGFYTLTEFSKVEVTKGSFDKECKWWPVAELPPLMFDHHFMITEALKALRMHISFFPIGYELLTEKFTLPEIHALYETILGRKLDERNFQKRLLASGIVIKLNETKRVGAHRSPFLYQFDHEKYKEGLKSGVLLAF